MVARCRLVVFRLIQRCTRDLEELDAKANQGTHNYGTPTRMPGPQRTEGNDERRRAPRIRCALDTFFSSERQEGLVVLENVSSSGALLERTESRPPLGARVRLMTYLPGRTTPLQLIGRVVRITDSGFAVHYETPNPEVFQRIKDVVEGRDQLN